MSAERTADAAVAIQTYLDGLRAELGMLRDRDRNDTVDEVRTMLLDAARDDPGRAFTEMERLGAPAQLATDLLAERGIGGAEGIPVASWWRLGIAAVIDTTVGLAAPALIIVTFWGILGPLWQSNRTGALIITVGIAAAIALTGWLAWRYWTPWRAGTPASTAGMAIAHVAVVRVGDKRMVARLSDLRAAGLAVPEIKMTSPGIIASVLLAIWLATAAFTSIGAGALDPSGRGVISRYAGAADRQQREVSMAVNDLYQAAVSASGDALYDWPPMTNARMFSLSSTRTLAELLADRYKGMSVDGDQGFAIGRVISRGPGLWTVDVSEAPLRTPARHVTLTYVLRVQWQTDPEAQPQNAWVLADYVVK